jgi:hypothetical protein
MRLGILGPVECLADDGRPAGARFRTRRLHVRGPGPRSRRDSYAA